MSWVAQCEMRRMLWMFMLQEELQSERWGERGTVDACSRLLHTTHTHRHSDLAQLSMPLDALCQATIYTVHVYLPFLCAQFIWMDYIIREGTCIFIYVCVWLCRSLWNDCTVVNKQKQALALMKGCCHLFCRSVTIRAPSGSSDRLFFCITLNKRVQCINLTLLGETKEGPLIQHYNSARMETSGVSSPATHDSAMITAQYREDAVCFIVQNDLFFGSCFLSRA